MERFGMAWRGEARRGLFTQKERTMTESQLRKFCYANSIFMPIKHKGRWSLLLVGSRCQGWQDRFEDRTQTGIHMNQDGMAFTKRIIKAVTKGGKVNGLTLAEAAEIATRGARYFAGVATS
jgi:hypothetical protein